MLVECVEDSISRFVHCYLGSSGRRQSDIDGVVVVEILNRIDHRIPKKITILRAQNRTALHGGSRTTLSSILS